MKRDILKPIFDIFFPEQCMLCASNNAINNLCDGCNARCHRCPVGPFGFSKDHKGAIFFYELTIRDALKSAKFNRNFAYWRMLCEILKQELSQNEHVARIRDFRPTGIAYVPTHWVRRSLRGLDMPSSFALILAQHLNLPLVHALTKTTLKKPQSSIHSKSSRLSAVKNMFKIKSKIKTYERLILVDDIVTTGATFDECSKTLKSISQEVLCLAFAKTP